MNINIKNVEELIFFDKNVQKKLPEFRNLFDQWSLGKRLNALSNMVQKSLLDFLNHINENHINILKNHFNQDIVIDKISYNITQNLELNLQDDLNLCQYDGYKDFILSRNKNTLKITFWR